MLLSVSLEEAVALARRKIHFAHGYTMPRSGINSKPNLEGVFAKEVSPCGLRSGCFFFVFFQAQLGASRQANSPISGAGDTDSFKETSGHL